MRSNEIVLFVGDVGVETQQAATEFDTTAKLVTQKNYSEMSAGVFYTSIGDFDSVATFFKALNLADELRLVTPTMWSDTKNNRSLMELYTKKCLLYFKGRKKVYADDVPEDQISMLELKQSRKSGQPQLWIAGCSISHGVGVEPDQRYGQLLADQLDLSVSFLTQPSSSIAWAADQILRSPIQAGDTVVWGITSHRRYPYFDQTIKHINTYYYSRYPEFDKVISLERLDDHNMIYQALTKIYQVINFCQLGGVKIQLVCLLVDDEFLPYAFNLPNAIHLFRAWEFEAWPDLGNDNVHPGIKTHQLIADEIIKVL